MGLTYDETMDLPFVRLLDLIAVHQIKAEGWRCIRSAANADQELFQLLRLK